MIEKYEFGRMVVDGKSFTKDLIIFSGSFTYWMRQESHKVALDDMKDIFAAQPGVIVIGTGHDGMMEVLKEVVDYCKQKKIKLIIKKTGAAIKDYEKQKEEGQEVVGAFHLTC